MLAPELGLALLAGSLSTLSPCVLPILPIVLAGARAEHRLAPLALASGVGLSLALVGGLVAALGQGLGLYVYHAQRVSAALLIGIGLVLVLGSFQRSVSMALSPIAGFLGQAASRFGGKGLGGQAVLGLLLGGAWTPCVGPTLGAAAVLAAQGQDLGFAISVMLMFGLGAATPLLLLASSIRGAARRMDSFRKWSRWTQPVLGGACLLIGTAVLSGMSKAFEAILIENSPEWLTNLTTLI